MWRPKGWENPYQIQLDAISSGTGIDGRQGNILKGASDTFEVGADAMLKAIRERGFIIGESLRKVGHGWATFDPKGKWYSIPDDD